MIAARISLHEQGLGHVAVGALASGARDAVVCVGVARELGGMTAEAERVAVRPESAAVCFVAVLARDAPRRHAAHPEGRPLEVLEEDLAVGTVRRRVEDLEIEIVPELRAGHVAGGDDDPAAVTEHAARHRGGGDGEQCVRIARSAISTPIANVRCPGAVTGFATDTILRPVCVVGVGPRAVILLVRRGVALETLGVGGAPGTRPVAPLVGRGCLRVDVEPLVRDRIVADGKHLKPAAGPRRHELLDLASAEDVMQREALRSTVAHGDLDLESPAGLARSDAQAREGAWLGVECRQYAARHGTLGSERVKGRSPGGMLVRVAAPTGRRPDIAGGRFDGRSMTARNE